MTVLSSETSIVGQAQPAGDAAYQAANMKIAEGAICRILLVEYDAPVRERLAAIIGRWPGGRLVANAVTVESEAVLLQWYSTMGGELRRYQHYRGEPVGSFTGWRPAMPVTQWSVTK